MMNRAHHSLGIGINAVAGLWTGRSVRSAPEQELILMVLKPKDLRRERGSQWMCVVIAILFMRDGLLFGAFIINGS